jgi:3',5'-cyclic AMP phosphodiesterase CpdA
MTKVNPISDAHADFTGGAITLPAVDCDVHLVLGDAAAPMTTALRIVAEALQHSTAPKIYVPGNHDFYISNSEPSTYYQDQLERGRRVAEQCGINLLVNQSMLVGDTRILGTTLWTDIAAGDPSMSRKQKMQQSQRGYLDGRPNERDYHNDFREIRYGGPGNRNRFTPSQWLQLHEEAMNFLRAEIALEHIGETVIASHMAPHPTSLMGGPDGHNMHDWLYSCTDCDDLFQHVNLWLHGHIHQSRDYEIDGCRILSNPRGYPTDPRRRDAGKSVFENSSWDPGLVVEVEPRCDRRVRP